MIKFGLPNKGALAEETQALIGAAGYECSRHSGELMAWDRAEGIQFVFLRPRDIAVYVGRGILDMGISGRDFVCEVEAEVDEVLALGFGRSKFCYAAPQAPEDWNGLRIATSFPGLVERDLTRRKLQAEVVRLDGAVEISVHLGIADLVADVVQSGRTLEKAGLKVIGSPLLESEAVAIAPMAQTAQSAEVATCLKRLEGIVLARTYVLIEYDVPTQLLNQVCALTPGIEAPTVSPLQKSAWVAVKSMAKREGINQVMDDLVKLGARGVFVSDIRTCRL